MFDLTLTFDNGPDETVTPIVHDVLARRGVSATFFVVGKMLAQPGGQRLAREAHAQGHWIGNHTFSHSVPLGEQSDAALTTEEIERSQQLIGDLAHPDRLFRPFGGGGHLDSRLLNDAAVAYLTRERFTCVLWNAIPRDWRDPEGWAERAIAQCRAQAWTLMVLHDLPTGAMRHLDQFIGQALDAGARFRQDFPPDCVPIIRGEIVRPIAPYVAPRQPAVSH